MELHGNWGWIGAGKHVGERFPGGTAILYRSFLANDHSAFCILCRASSLLILGFLPIPHLSAKMALMMKRSAVAARPAVSRKAVVTCVARQSWLPGSEIPKHLDSPAALAMAGNFGKLVTAAFLYAQLNGESGDK
jgi:hypothetical protein